MDPSPSSRPHLDRCLDIVYLILLSYYLIILASFPVDTYPKDASFGEWTTCMIDGLCWNYAGGWWWLDLLLDAFVQL